MVVGQAESDLDPASAEMSKFGGLNLTRVKSEQKFVSLIRRDARKKDDGGISTLGKRLSRNTKGRKVEEEQRKGEC